MSIRHFSSVSTPCMERSRYEKMLCSRNPNFLEESNAVLIRNNKIIAVSAECTFA